MTDSKVYTLTNTYKKSSYENEYYTKTILEKSVTLIITTTYRWGEFEVTLTEEEKKKMLNEEVVCVNDYETFDFGFRLNLNLPIAYVSIGEALSFNEYFEFDSSNNSALIRSDVANTFDVIVVKPLGDFLPFLDPNKLINLSFSYDKTISEANIINYDYEAESFGFGISRSFDLRG